MNKLVYLFFIVSLCSGCKKYLAEKPDQSLTVPASLADYQSMLDQPEIVNPAAPAVGDLCSDDYYMTYSRFQANAVQEQNGYTWVSNTWAGIDPPDWNRPYYNIYHANVVMEGLNDFPVTAGEQSTYNAVYGHALYIRAFSHYMLEEAFGQPYRPASATTDLGIPLRLSSLLSARVHRATVAAVYDQIITDLKRAVQLLPVTSALRNRPIKAAAYAILARTYLTMQNYPQALLYADSTLKSYGTLVDYNTITVTATTSRPFPAPPNDFAEVITPAGTVSYSSLVSNYTNVDTTLYKSYDDNDLRKSIFFIRNSTTNTWYFRGKYTGSSFTLSAAPTVDEAYLVRAEAYARANNVTAAMADLNTLLRKRWKNTVPYPAMTATDADDALRKILVERRKELLFRGLRWIDLRRLNQDSRFAITLVRNLNGQIITLPPNSPKYALPIPDNEILLSGIPQNQR